MVGDRVDVKVDLDEVAEELANDIVRLMREGADRSVRLYREKLMESCMLVDGKPNVEAMRVECVLMLQCCGAAAMADQVCDAWDAERKIEKEVEV